MGIRQCAQTWRGRAESPRDARLSRTSIFSRLDVHMDVVTLGAGGGVSESVLCEEERAPLRGEDPELTRGCALGPPARLQPVDKSCHQQSRRI